METGSGKQTQGTNTLDTRAIIKLVKPGKKP